MKTLLLILMCSGAAIAAQSLFLQIEQTSHHNSSAFAWQNAGNPPTTPNGVCVDSVGTIHANGDCAGPFIQALANLGYVVKARVTAQSGSTLGTTWTSGCTTFARSCQQDTDVDTHWGDFAGRGVYLEDGPTNDVNAYTDDGTILANAYVANIARRRAGAPVGTAIIVSTVFARDWDTSSYPLAPTVHRGLNNKIVAACAGVTIWDNGSGGLVYQCGAGLSYAFLVSVHTDTRIGYTSYGSTSGPTWNTGVNAAYFGGDHIHFPTTAGTTYDTIYIPLWIHAIMAAAPPSIGRGCSTMWYIDNDCDGYGVARRANGDYGPLNITTSAGYNQAVGGDMPDADDNDPTVRTVADWRAKYGGGAGDTTVATLRAFLLASRGYNPSKIAIIDQGGGNDSTGCVWSASNPTCQPYTHAYATPAAVYGLFTGNTGGAIIYRGGEYDQVGPQATGTGGIAGSPTERLIFMAYPGEHVNFGAPYDGNFAFDFQFLSPARGYMIFDGLEARTSPATMAGSSWQFFDSTDITIRNCEFSQHSKALQIQDHTRNFIIENSVFHDQDGHDLYFGGTSAQAHLDVDFDFAANDAAYANPADTSCITPDGTTGLWNVPSRCHGYADNIWLTGSLFYRSGASGTEPIHMNQYARNVHVIGNIVHNTGGTGLGVQTTWYDSEILNNLIFANGRYGMTLNLYGAACYPTYTHDLTDPCHRAAGHFRRVNIINNTIWTGDGFTGTGITSRDNMPYGGILISGPEDVPPGHHIIKDFRLENNVIMTKNVPYLYSNVPVTFAQDVDLSTFTIRNNTFFNIDPSRNNSTDSMMQVSTNYPSCQNYPDAGQSTCTAIQNSGIAYTMSAFSAYNSAWVSNSQADPKITSYMTDGLPIYPYLLVADLQSTSPAIGAAYATDAPTTDIRGVTRSAPDTGAFEFGGTITCTATLSPAFPGPYTVGQPVTVNATAANCGTGTLTWTSSGLPAGLSGCNAVTGTTCAITGTASAAGSFSGTVSVADGGSNSATTSPSITVNVAPTISSSGALPAGTQGSAYSQSLATSGGTGSLTCAVVTGSLPAGLSFSGCTVTGTPGGTGTSTVTVHATDANSITGATSASLSITINASSGSTPASVTGGLTVSGGGVIRH